MRWAALPLLLVGLLVWFVFRPEPAGDRTTREPEARAWPEAPERSAEAGEPGRAAPRPESPPLPVVATLTGRVFDPRGRPLFRAQVWILRPRPLRLSVTDMEGRFELPLHRRGKHLVEAEWFTELRPERRTVEVPETGDPPAIAFHLRASGTIYGELTAGGEPVSYAQVDVYDGEDWILDTEAYNGLFVFEQEPPVGKPLELRVTATEGYPKEPVRFTWKGTPLDLGIIELRRFPSCAVRVVLPDGSETAGVEAWLFPGGLPEEAEDGRYGRIVPVGGTPIFQQGGVLRIAPPGPSTREVWLGIGAPGGVPVPHLVRATLTFDETPREPVELKIRPGPFRVRGRIVDDRGRAMPSRFRIADVPEAVHETDEEGRFEVEVPCGGVHRLLFSAFELPEAGGRIASVEEGATLGGCWLDADRPGEPCRFRATGRVLFLCGEQAVVRVGSGPQDRYFRTLVELENGSFASLSRPFDEDATVYQWFIWPGPGPTDERSLPLAARGLTVVRLPG